MHPWSVLTVRYSTHVYLHAQTVVDAGTSTPDESWLFGSQENPKFPQLESHAGKKRR